MSLYGSFSVLQRLKTAEALGRLAHMLPARVVRKLPPVRVYAPAPIWGEVLRLPCDGEILVYFPPDLEKLPQRCVNYVVAHEFAHIALGHYGFDFQYADVPRVEHHDERPEEQAADRLVAEWDYTTEDNPVHMDAAARQREADEEDQHRSEELTAENERLTREGYGSR